VTHPVHLKVELAVRGARVDPSVRLASRGEGGGSVDLLLPGDIRVDVRVDEPHASSSPFVLLAERGRHFLVRHAADGPETERVDVRPVPRPRFYERRTSRGTPMWRVATVRGSHLLVIPQCA